MSVSSADGHEHFLYYLPARGMASLWLNHWINSNFDRLASKLGPKAVLITSPEGSEAEFLSSAREFQRIIQASLRPIKDSDSRDHILHEGAPMLIVSRHPLRLDGPQDRIDCAVINLAAYDQEELARLFDHLIKAVDDGDDPLDGIPVAAVSGAGGRDYDYLEALELKPNIFGLGINGNAVVKMLRTWREKRRSRVENNADADS